MGPVPIEIVHLGPYWMEMFDQDVRQMGLVLAGVHSLTLLLYLFIRLPGQS